MEVWMFSWKGRSLIRHSSGNRNTRYCSGSAIKQSLPSIQIHIYIHAYELVSETIVWITWVPPHRRSRCGISVGEVDLSPIQWYTRLVAVSVLALANIWMKWDWINESSNWTAWKYLNATWLCLPNISIYICGRPLEYQWVVRKGLIIWVLLLNQ